VQEPAADVRLGAYRIVGKLGEGAMGIVHEGRHDLLGRRVAIKVLRPELARDPQISARFLREAIAANAVRHENIVAIYDHGTTPDGGAYLVMELLEGETLADRERRVGRLALPELARVFEQVLRALAEAHGRGVVHRDLKPANVFLVRRPDDPLFVKLLDFGVAKLSAEHAAQKLTSTGMVLGTPLYMSPEQILGRAVDARSDLFSVGVMLYQAATGELPFRGGNMGEVAASITAAAPPPPRALRPELPAELEAVILTALARDPARRHPTAAAMLEALGRATRPWIAPTAAHAPLPRASSRRRIGVAIIAAGAAVAIVVPLVARRPATQAPVTDAAPAAPTAAQVLRDAVTSPEAAEAEDAVAALALAGGPRAAPLLYPALQGPPELRRQAARALEALGLPEAAPRVRAVLEGSGPRLRVELAATLAALGDREALPVLRRGLDEPGTRLPAALGLCAAGETEAARPVLAEILASTPHGRAERQQAAAALAALGDPAARAALVDELAQPDAGRAVSAAAHLARLGDPAGRAFLERVVADEGFARRAEAALALARLGGRDGLPLVAPGLGSVVAEERQLAAALAAHLGDERARGALERLARDDPDRRTRLTAAAALLALKEIP
jgi:serine/threonine-protein kinase